MAGRQGAKFFLTAKGAKSAKVIANFWFPQLSGATCPAPPTYGA